jgi:hypothetical protein
MKTKDFLEKVVEPRLAYCKEILCVTKDAEYTKDNDKFYNFKRTAEVRRINKYQALDGMYNKHLISMIDIIDEAKKGCLPSKELLREKITDNINYLLLFEGMVDEDGYCIEVDEEWKGKE